MGMKENLGLPSRILQMMKILFFIGVLDCQNSWVRVRVRENVVVELKSEREK